MSQPPRPPTRPNRLVPNQAKLNQAGPKQAAAKQAAAKQAKPSLASSPPFHPRNRHQGRYDFADLLTGCPELAGALIKTPAAETSIDFSRPDSVRLLNQALLKLHYAISHWDIPAGYLCPPIPGRADYVHALADLLAVSHAGEVPQGSKINVLDVGVGASCIYPLLGHREYGWQFVGSDIDPVALASAVAIVGSNPGLGAAIELRRQHNATHIFSGVLRADDRFDLSLCNPPFHASAAEANAGSQRKWRQLGKPVAARRPPHLNFGGQANELWCRGGERAFLRQMIRESVDAKPHILWFSSLVSKAQLLPALRQQLQTVAACEVRVVAMAQGNKQSRFIAWTFHDEAERREWRQRWK